MPLINDITTDVNNPPKFVFLSKKLNRDLSYPTDFKKTQQARYPEIKSVELEMSPKEAYKKILSLAKAQSGWKIELEDQDNLRIEAISVTKVFRFKDLVAIEVFPAAIGARIEMRSKSLIGKSDLGKNASRIRDFFEKLQ